VFAFKVGYLKSHLPVFGVIVTFFFLAEAPQCFAGMK